MQSRGGCQCAGPYAQRLLGLERDNSNAIEQSLIEDKTELLRPGFSRLSLPYYMSEAEVSYALAAVTFVASQGP